jgi:phosphatidylserine/phosphatidylglycerophosphate/cardiolipin synthase-like enzyme
MTNVSTKVLLWAGLLAILGGCATTLSPDDCPSGTQKLPDCPPLEAVDDPYINALYERRTWVHESDQEFDPVELGLQAKIPVQPASTRFLGARSEDAINSLAAKIWLIENAQHTIDATYYIFKRDLVGEALLGALCDAVQRGVDVRFMVDSVGSIDTSHAGLKALATCAESAGFMRNANGELTTRKARVQVVLFNALSKVFVRLNRRSHDKLLIVDGNFPDRAVIMTGGRNVSLSYYGIRADGSPNPDTYMDAEILVRPIPDDASDAPSVGMRSPGDVAGNYYSILFLFGNNKELNPWTASDAVGVYASDREEAQAALAKLKALPVVKQSLEAMPEFFAEGWHESRVLLAHELDNLTNKNLFNEAEKDFSKNKNSITYLLRKVRGDAYNKRRIVSPYLFAMQHYDDEGNIVFDGAVNARNWLEQHPDATLEIVTNSVLTSDNFSAQAVIDMNMAPRLLLTEEMQELWLEDREDSELNPALVESEEWKKLVNHPRLKIYETGRLDARELGGDVDYGKLHAKYIVMDNAGFVGTTNFDSRSTLINNEMGFFFKGDAMAQDLHDDFDLLKSRSYLWGSPEWLEMRRRVFELGGLKGNTSESQRAVYKTLRGLNLDHHF